MNLNFHRRIMAAGAGVLLAANVLAADTNETAGVTRDEITSNYLHIQEQLHATQLAIEQSRLAAVESAKNSSDLLAARLQALEQSVAVQHATDTDTARRTQQLTLLLAGAFGLAGLGIMLLMVYFLWRALTQLAQISSHQHTALAGTEAGHQLATPGRATVETSNARLLDTVAQLEKRIHELESGQRFLPEVNTPAADPLVEGQKLLDANAPEKALDFFEKFLAAQPRHAEALVKRAMALEKLGRAPEALAACDAAIKADEKLVIAHLHKGGLLNRLRRYDEALDCYEKALLAQEKRPAAVS